MPHTPGSSPILPTEYSGGNMGQTFVYSGVFSSIKTTMTFNLFQGCGQSTITLHTVKQTWSESTLQNKSSGDRGCP